MAQEFSTLNIHFRNLDTKVNGYPIDLILDGERYLLSYVSAEDILAWQPGEDVARNSKELSDLFFADERLLDNWLKIRKEMPNCRIRLSFDDHPSVAKLHAIPWELLLDGKPKRIKDEYMLTINKDTPFSRHVIRSGFGPSEPISEYPIRILVAIANPKNLVDQGLAEINEDIEKSIIGNALTSIKADQVKIDFLSPPVTLDSLADKLEKVYHVLHLVAHGHYVQKKELADLYLEDENRGLCPVAEEEFAAKIGPLRQSTLKLIFLASCQSAQLNKNNPLRGIAPALLQVGVPSVLAMQAEVQMGTAQTFISKFYRELFRHGQIDLACNEARRFVDINNLPGSYIPVLYSRLRNNKFLAPQKGSVIERNKKIREPETVYIPEGEFIMGSAPDEGRPKEETISEEDKRRIYLSAFRIGRYPVTNWQYQAYLEDTGERMNPYARGWNGNVLSDDKRDHPVAGIAWNEARAYCDWLKDKTGWHYCLPSEAQWERAARRTEGCIYPWGDDWEKDRCNQNSNQITTVCAYKPQNEYGIYDLIGNVMEWTNTRWGKDEYEPDHDYSYPWKDDKREDSRKSNYILRVYRGGLTKDERVKLRCSARGGAKPDKPASRGRPLGFRVAIKL